MGNHSLLEHRYEPSRYAWYSRDLRPPSGKVRLLGLTGYLLFSGFWAFSVALHFIEAFISPVVVAEAPKFVEGLLGMVAGHASEINLGALPTVYGLLIGVVGYVLGGLLFGIATFRANVLPRWAGGLLALGTLLPVLLSSVVNHPFDWMCSRSSSSAAPVAAR